MEHLEVKEVDAWNVVDDELDTDNFEKPWNGEITNLGDLFVGRSNVI